MKWKLQIKRRISNGKLLGSENQYLNYHSQHSTLWWRKQAKSTKNELLIANEMPEELSDSQQP